MKQLLKKHHPKKHIKSFHYAFQGIWHALINEANFRVHLIATIFAITLGFYFKISNIEWALLVLISAMVLTSELINTVVENVIDYLFKDYNSIAKIIKDLAAGFVLINAIAAVFIFLLIFARPLQDKFNTQPIIKKNTKVISIDQNQCNIDSDCIVSGCNAEICGTEVINSICVVPENPLPKDLGQTCGCSNNICQWSN